MYDRILESSLPKSSMSIHRWDFMLLGSFDLSNLVDLSTLAKTGVRNCGGE